MLRYLAIHLPQYHPIPENDEWWGKGFTEWTNVVKARPLFKNHYQPHLPADLGFYDLRLLESIKAQADLARDYGIDGFCFYHYWFHGRRLLHRPLDLILTNNEIDFPFCIFWANETWEGRWHGITNQKKTLVKQEYSEEDDLNHIRWIAEVVSDKRYICVDNRPVLVVYKPYDLPDCNKTIGVWREECQRLGIPNPYLIASNSHAYHKQPLELGFDAVLQFLPQLGVLDCFTKIDWKYKIKKMYSNIKNGVLSSKLNVYDYEKSVLQMIRPIDGPVHRSLFPSWDNTARSGEKGVVFLNSKPDIFENILAELSRKTVDELAPDRQIMFINAWNEWAEGNHLEPDVKNGKGYLEAIRRVKSVYL